MAEIKRIQKNQRGGARPGAGRKRGIPARALKVDKDDLAARAREYASQALASLLEIATSGESEAARVTAASALLDRGYGRPRQAVEHSGPDGGPVPVQVWHFGGRKVAF